MLSMNIHCVNQSYQFMKIKILTICLLGLSFSGCEKPETHEGAGADWAHYLGGATSNQYSNLNQINKENVKKLKVAWTYDTGDSGHYQVNNLIIDGKLYTTSPLSRVTALDGATGEHIWTFDPSDVHGHLA